MAQIYFISYYYTSMNHQRPQWLLNNYYFLSLQAILRNNLMFLKVCLPSGLFAILKYCSVFICFQKKQTKQYQNKNKNYSLELFFSLYRFNKNLLWTRKINCKPLFRCISWEVCLLASFLCVIFIHLIRTLFQWIFNLTGCSKL